MKVSLDMRSVLLLIKTGIENEQYQPTINLIDNLLERLDKQEDDVEKEKRKKIYG